MTAMPPAALPRLALAVSLLVMCSCAVPGNRIPGRAAPDDNRGLACRLIVNRGIYLKNEMDLLSSMPPERTSPATRWKLNRRRHELAAMTGDIALCGEWALKEKDEDLAERWLALAAVLEPSPGIAALVERMRGPARPAIRKPGRRGGAPMPAPARGGARKDMRAVAGAKSAEKPRGEVQAKTAAMLSRARALYSSGAMAEAERLWRQVLAIDPDNHEAARGIERARRVRQRLESLAAGQ